MSELKCSMPGCGEDIASGKWCKQHIKPSIEMKHSYNGKSDRIHFQDCQFDPGIDRGMVTIIGDVDLFGGLPIVSEYKKADQRNNK